VPWFEFFLSQVRKLLRQMMDIHQGKLLQEERVWLTQLDRKQQVLTVEKY